MARSGLRAPVNVTWEVTGICNLRCSHCLSDSGPERGDELTTRECLDLIQELSELKVFQVNIGGGEPFLREDFVDLLQSCHLKGIVTCVSTNGMVVDDSLARKLASLRCLYLQVSLDGASPCVNDAIRGGGTFPRILSAIDCLSRNQVPFSINTVLTRLNFPELEDLRKLARSFGADLRVSRFRPSGRGRDSRDSLGPSKDQLEGFAEWLDLHDMVKTGDSFFCLTSDSRRMKGLDMCGAAKMTCCISPTGEVYPCAFLQEREFHAGSIRLTAFKEIWDNAPIFMRLRGLDVELCRVCPRFEHCRGGCPAMAHHTYGDISMPDPECLVNLGSARAGQTCDE
jgi:mycofactocin biosynthetic radical S-adenosylmethionine protein MftC